MLILLLFLACTGKIVCVGEKLIEENAEKLVKWLLKFSTTYRSDVKIAFVDSNRKKGCEVGNLARKGNEEV